MKSLIIFSILACSGFAQRYDFTTLVQPGDSIDGHTFTSDTRIEAVALNDDGEIAFLARWSNPLFAERALFTAKRLVTGEQFGEHDCRTILFILPDSITIRGDHVAYRAWYESCDSPTRKIGLFLDDHLMTNGNDSPLAALTNNFIIPLYDPPKPPSPFVRNSKGQILIPVNLERGFLLLLGTPVTH